MLHKLKHYEEQYQPTKTSNIKHHLGYAIMVRNDKARSRKVHMVSFVPTTKFKLVWGKSGPYVLVSYQLKCTSLLICENEKNGILGSKKKKEERLVKHPNLYIEIVY